MMPNELRTHSEAIISFFDHDLRWWEDVYKDFLPKGFFSYEMRQRLRLVTDHLAEEIRNKDNPQVLECGCGPGDILASLAPLRCTLTGLDLNPRYLALAAQKVPQATLIEGNAEKLPFPDESFDIVYAVGLLPYLRDDHKAGSEIARVTKSGGFVLISVPNYRMLHLFLDPYYVFRFLANLTGFGKDKTKFGFDESKIRRYSLAQLRNLFRENGLYETRSMSTSFGPWKFWRRELLPLRTSIRISECIRRCSEVMILGCLKHVGNHLIVIMRKGRDPSAEAKE